MTRRTRRNSRRDSSFSVASPTKRLSRLSFNVYKSDRDHLFTDRFFDDLRLYHPKPHLRDFKMLSGSRATLGSFITRRLNVVRYLPLASVLCARRKERRQVIFAMGKGGGSHAPPRRTSFSDILCGGRR